MNTEMQSMWKEAVEAWFEFYPRIFPEGLRNSTNNLNHDDDGPVDIRTGHLPIKSHKPFRFRQVDLRFLWQ